MTEEERLEEAFWGPGGWADRLWQEILKAHSEGRSSVEVGIDLNPPERYDYYD